MQVELLFKLNIKQKAVNSSFHLCLTILNDL